MAKHKAPTEVTLVPTEERRGFALWVERNWKLAAALAAVLTIAILSVQYLGQKKELAKDESWARLSRAIDGAARGSIVGDSSAVRAAVTELTGTIAAPWSRFVLALSLQVERKFEDSVQALEELRSTSPDSFLVKERYVFSEDPTPRSLVEQMVRVAGEQASWQAAHPTLFANPAAAADAPKVRIRTDKGNIQVVLYPDQAPLHVENFLELCRAGFYDGTKFHRLTQGVVEGGDPNTKTGDPSTWGQGSNGGSISPEPNQLFHFEGALSAAKTSAGGDSSDCQFRITSVPAHHLDEGFTVFGQVVEGLDVVRAIAEGEVVDTVRFQPAAPVGVQGTDVL